MNTDSDQPTEDAAESDIVEPADGETPVATEKTVYSEEEGGEEDQLAALQTEAEENWDKYLRAAAELENVRKRASRDVENAHKFGLERFATDLLAVCDSLEMALKSDQEGSSIESLKAGNEATLKLLGSVLQRFGVEEINPVGESFDPMLHEAMTVQHASDVEPGDVVTVYQKGYALNGRLMRPARVVVAGDPAEVEKNS